MANYLQKLNHNHSCFSLVVDELINPPINEENSCFFEIVQDLGKTKVAVDSIFSTNLLELFLMNGENLLLTLPKENKDGNLIKYSFFSHATTFYFLNTLSKEGFIQIEESGKSKDTLKMNDYSAAFLQSTSKRMRLYHVSFFLTDKKITPEALISLNKSFGIDPGTFNYDPVSKFFQYNYLHQLKCIIENTFGIKRMKEGFVHNFDHNTKLWHLPIKIMKSINFVYVIEEEVDYQKVLK